jgi:hypothetical protein
VPECCGDTKIEVGGWVIVLGVSECREMWLSSASASAALASGASISASGIDSRPVGTRRARRLLHVSAFTLVLVVAGAALTQALEERHA